ncbi:UNVERIFIED_CONTAM: hypothetical protein PYX00_003623 [Menopon gallinae]|uniref:Ribosomal protein S9 n=1 Tax=Menopon gallinae TaxID=328185 RepID=A0AAW2I392_9NEOP
MLGKVDVKATVSEGGETSQSGTVRIGISKAIRPFVPPEMLLRMMVAGLMHADPRTNERQKPGRRGARARYTWLKR